MAASDLIIFGQALSLVQLFKSTTPLDVYTVLFVTLPTPSCLDTCMYPRILCGYTLLHVSATFRVGRLECGRHSPDPTTSPSQKTTYESDTPPMHALFCVGNENTVRPFISTDFCRLALVPVSSRVAASDLISAYPNSCLRMVSAAVRRSCHGCAFSVQVPRSGHIWKLELISYPACHRLVLRGHMSSSVGRYGSCRALNEPIVREFTDALCD
ncbi:hypothetical protein B0H10DRAFT_1071603 [Mycena sp. CBHHK59/15]|nr:hypothetical protein B0H10DRAFT_1071603 [Mycena sp. CBHHK59/15]